MSKTRVSPKPQTTRGIYAKETAPVAQRGGHAAEALGGPMSAENATRPPAWGYMIHYPDTDEPVGKSPEDALSCALALQRIAYLMKLGMDTPETVEDGDDELLNHLFLYGWAWTRQAGELLAAERKAAQAPPSPPGNVTDLMEALKRSLKRHDERA